MQTAHYGTLVIRPHSMQFAIDELPLLLLCLAGYGCAWIENLAGSGILSGASVLCSLYLLYRFIYLRRTEYLISSEQIIYRHGVFSRSCDYMELYRVVDFRGTPQLPATTDRAENCERVFGRPHDPQTGYIRRGIPDESCRSYP